MVSKLGIASMLYALGLAFGLSSIDPQDAGSLRPSGIFSAIWLLAVSLIALFVGGYVASRGAGALSRGFGALHGLVMWGLTVVAGAWLLGNVASAVLRRPTTWHALCDGWRRARRRSRPTNDSAVAFTRARRRPDSTARRSLPMRITAHLGS